MKISKDMSVAEVFDRYPQTHPVFERFGFGAVSNPALRSTFGKITSVENGCRHHGVALDEFLKALNGSLESEKEG